MSIFGSSSEGKLETLSANGHGLLIVSSWAWLELVSIGLHERYVHLLVVIVRDAETKLLSLVSYSARLSIIIELRMQTVRSR